MLFMKVLLLLPTLILGQPWIPDPRCPGYNDSTRRNLNSPATLPEPESDEPVAPPALRQEQGRSLQEYGDLPTFQLKLHWEEGFCWQSEWDERVYCMDCDSRTCNDGGIMEIQYCSYESEGEDVRDQRLQWIPEPDDPQMGRLKAASGNLCMDRIMNKNYELRECDFNSVRQLLIGFSYTEPFELFPEYNVSRCLNQQHDPRIFERVELTDCSVARRVNTNRWEVVELEGDIPDEFLDNLFDRDDAPSFSSQPSAEPSHDPTSSSQPSAEPSHDPTSSSQPSAEPSKTLTSSEAPTFITFGGQGNETATPIGGICFPSDVTVIEESKGRIPIKDLSVGDSILGPNNKYSRVYAFGHKAPRAKNLPYLTLEVESGSTLSLSEHHILFLSNGKSVAARLIKVGDELQDQSRVISVTKSYKTGAIAPFTTDGKFIANDHFVVSSYVDVGVSHNVVHMVLPLVLLLVMGGSNEEYDEHGLNVWLPTFETAVMAIRFGKMICTLGVAALLTRRLRYNNAKGV